MNNIHTEKISVLHNGQTLAEQCYVIRKAASFDRA